MAVVCISVVNGKSKSEGVTFGMIANLTGDYAVVGEGFSKGIDLAREEWNTSHPQFQIQVIKEDDGFDPKKGISAYRKLTSIDHVDGLINVTTVTIDALYDELVKTKLPVALAFEQSIAAKKDNIVQLWPGSGPAEKKLGETIREKGFKNVVVFVDNASAAFDRFASEFKQGYGLPVQEVRISASGTDLKDSALKAVSFKPDAIVFIVKPTSGALLVKEIRSISKTPTQFVFDANIQAGMTDYKKVLGDTNVLNGSILYAVPMVYRSQFSESFKKKFGSETTIGSETGYNSFMLLARSYNNDKTKWISNMQTASFEGADGKIYFDENGVRIPELKIGTIENGELPK